MDWRPISEVPPDVDRILAFVPDNWSEPYGRYFDDDRICVVYRTDRGWRFDHYEGGYEVEPTHFCVLDLPDGAPADPRCR